MGIYICFNVFEHSLFSQKSRQFRCHLKWNHFSLSFCFSVQMIRAWMSGHFSLHRRQIQSKMANNVLIRVRDKQSFGLQNNKWRKQTNLRSVERKQRIDIFDHELLTMIQSSVESEPLRWFSRAKRQKEKSCRARDEKKSNRKTWMQRTKGKLQVQKRMKNQFCRKCYFILGVKSDKYSHNAAYSKLRLTRLPWMHTYKHTLCSLHSLSRPFRLAHVRFIVARIVARSKENNNYNP